VQFGVELTEDVVEAINAEVVYLTTLPAVLTARITELLSRKSVQAVCRPVNHLHLTVPTYETSTSCLMLTKVHGVGQNCTHSSLVY